MADAPTAFPAGDPRNAKYFETLAQLEHGYQRTLGEAAEQRQNARTNAQYAEGQIKKAEPGGFRNVRNQANNEGLLQSGIEAGRTGSLQSRYAAQRYGVTHGLQEREGSLTRQEQRAKEGYENSRAGAASNAREEYRQYAEAQQPQQQAQTPIAAAAAKRVGGKYVTNKLVNGKWVRVYQAY